MGPFTYISARLQRMDPILFSALVDDGDINIEQQTQNWEAY